MTLPTGEELDIRDLINRGYVLYSRLDRRTLLPVHRLEWRTSLGTWEGLLTWPDGKLGVRHPRHPGADLTLFDLPVYAVMDFGPADLILTIRA